MTQRRPSGVLVQPRLHLEVKLANEVAEWLQIGPAGPSPLVGSPRDGSLLWVWWETDTLKICLLPSLELQGEGIGSELGRCCPRVVTPVCSLFKQAISYWNMVRK